MKFPRNTKLLRNPFDLAAFAAVFFLLLIFLMLTTLLPKSGIPLNLPAAGDLPGTDAPDASVAVDAEGRIYFANQIVSEAKLKSCLSDAAKNSREPLTLIIQADKTVTCEKLVRLSLLARDAGIKSALLATLPRVVNSPNFVP